MRNRDARVAVVVVCVVLVKGVLLRKSVTRDVLHDLL